MKRLYILKAGTTFPAIALEHGDFDAWTASALGDTGLAVSVLDVEQGAPLPEPAHCAGVVITGSHAMVTDSLPWSLALEAWLPALLSAGTPLLGICYGHQLLARAAGGQVGFHPRGDEAGTVPVSLLPESAGDALFMDIPQTFPAHVSHAQTVLSLPPGAVRLAHNSHEPHHAYRIGTCAWGVQFHPEFTAAIMRAYLREDAADLAAAGMDIPGVMAAVSETPDAARTVINFGQYARHYARANP